MGIWLQTSVCHFHPGKIHIGWKPSQKYLHDIALRDSGSSEEFYDKIRLLFLELLNFNKSENELVTAQDK